jgi:hypothetical protein
MLFKNKPWDFFKENPSILNQKKAGFLSIFCQDPFIERIIHQRIKQELVKIEGNLKFVLGGEITIDWLEDNYVIPGLFSGTEAFLVLHAEDLSAKVQDYILEHQIDFSENLLILSFTKKAKFFDKLTKNKEGNYFKIEMPMFWEGDRLLDFYCHEMRMNLSRRVREFLLESIPHESEHIVNSLKIIRVHLGNGNDKDLKEIKELIVATKFDKFRLAHLFSEKKKAPFFKELLKLKLPKEELMLFFSFMQGHLLKVSDPSYTEFKKGKLSKYDKEILQSSKHWNDDELKREINFFSKMQIKAKSGSVFLTDELRESYLETLSI